MKNTVYTRKASFEVSTLLDSKIVLDKKISLQFRNFAKKCSSLVVRSSFLLIISFILISINHAKGQLLTTSCKVGGSGATGGDGKIDYSKWNVTGLASGNGWYNQTNAATAHLNPATQNIKYGDVPGSTLAPTSSGNTNVNFAVGVTPFYDESTSLSVAHFVQIEGYLALPCYTSSLKIRVLANGDPVGVGTLRENYTSLHLSLNGGVPSTDPNLLKLVAKDKVNFSGTRLDTDPVTAGT